MAENDGLSRAKSQQRRPTITLPPRTSIETLFSSSESGVSPGPLTLVSSFFSENDPDSEYKSFSQLLAGAMASPVSLTSPKGSSFCSTSGEEEDSRESNKEFRFKQSRPLSLVIAQSSSPGMFAIPPGLSPGSLLDSPGGMFSPGQGRFGISHQQALAQVTAQAAHSQSHMDISSGYQSSLVAPHPVTSSEHSLCYASPSQHMPPLSSSLKSITLESSAVSHSDQRSQTLPLTVDKPADDGYNWRKYGQKHVKGSEYPRSYYKCTAPSCPVKKKVERSLDGQVTEIIYKGQHNHEKPQSIKRLKESGVLKGNLSQDQNGNVSKSNVTSKSKRDQESSQVTPEHLSSSSDGEEVGEAETVVDQREDEPDPKRRNTETRASELACTQRAVSESRIIVQTTSEVDLLDDGYRWRKYGQKVVKGNPHPRSYYKCTSAGCNVRKHVERASTDAKAVITTYEGKHNHDVPAAKHSSHVAAARLRSDNASGENHSLLNRKAFGSSDQQPVAHLRLKEEQVS
ncbi:hypothetical protein GIB67_039327 [Kingdonia uniflora]|uniref:WRKY domain-containing protein n=1 Tax=Kingdonia uniflora TaxID=39325 RepID=A0A7J7LX69_9MAGN|nr:hypothetical protein GIB67_039327 [Kingdonia uniflora]